jgi:hypothetical protein
MRWFRWIGLIAAAVAVPLAVLAAEPAASPAADAARWWRGNMHTHSFWSDGDDFPEIVAKWYKDDGYDFLAFTDHNTILAGERWRRLPEDHPVLKECRDAFGQDWVVMRPDKDANVQVRLRPLDEFRGKFEEPGKFLLMMGEEITNPHGVHLTAFDLDEAIPAVTGTPDERGTMIKEIVKEVDDYAQRSGRTTFAVLCHPNFMWAITAEMMIDAGDLRFFEVWNTNTARTNGGDEHRAGTERMWDIALAQRLSRTNGTLLYGLATDDAHNYHGGRPGPGQGWVMVRSPRLEPQAILEAMERGDFYATTGVVVRDVRRQGETIHVEIEPQEGVKYVTEYVGTLRGFDASSTPTLDADGQEIPITTRTYSDQIGRVLARSDETSSTYTFSGDELYVRVRITSTADHVNPITGESLGDKQRAWLQPMVPGQQKHQ